MAGKINSRAVGGIELLYLLNKCLLSNKTYRIAWLSFALCVSIFDKTKQTTKVDEIKSIFYKKGLRKRGRPLNFHEIPLYKTWFMHGNFVQI